MSVICKMTKKLIPAIILLFNQVCFAQLNTINTVSKPTPLGADDSVRIKELFFAGLKQKMAKHFPESDIFYKQILAIDPSNDATLYELANSYHEQKNLKDAERVIRDAITLNPRNEWYWALLIKIYFKTNNFSGVNEAADELLKIAPQKENYYFQKSAALQHLNKLDETLTLFELIQRNFGHSDALSLAISNLKQRQNKTNIAALELEKLIKNNPSHIGTYLQLSQLYYGNDEKDKALQILQTAKYTDPQNAEVRVALVNILRREGKHNEAYAELRSALENTGMDAQSKIRVLLSLSPQFTDSEVRKQATELAALLVSIYPTNIRIRTIYGDLLLQDKKAGEARQSYKDALKLNKHDYLIWDNLIRLEIDESDFDSAIKDGETALGIFPGNPSLYLYTGLAYFNKGENQKSLSLFNLAESKAASDSKLLSQIYAGSGDSYHALKHYKESEKLFEKALEVNPGNASALNKYAYYLSLKGDENLVRAQKLARLAYDLEPENLIYKNTSERITVLNSKYRSALDWVASDMGGLELSSQDYLVWANVVRIGYETSDFDGVIENGEKTITVFPDEATTYLYVALAYLQKKNYEKASDYLQRATSVQKDNDELQALIYSGFGELYKTLNKSAESDKAYERSLQLDPYNISTLNTYSFNLLLRGQNLDKAERMIRQVNELDPENPYYEYNYARILFRGKKYKDARTWIEKSVSHDETRNPEFLEHYGDILFHQGETELAVQQWAKAKSNGARSEKLERKINEKRYSE